MKAEALNNFCIFIQGATGCLLFAGAWYTLSSGGSGWVALGLGSIGVFNVGLVTAWSLEHP